MVNTCILSTNQNQLEDVTSITKKNVEDNDSRITQITDDGVTIRSDDVTIVSDDASATIDDVITSLDGSSILTCLEEIVNAPSTQQLRLLFDLYSIQLGRYPWQQSFQYTITTISIFTI